MKILSILITLLLPYQLLVAQNTFPSSGNVGIGTTNPVARLSFNNLNDGSNGADGITWYNKTPLRYGIYRTPGSWTGPDFQQLKISWVTGLILDPGTAYGRSFVEMTGGGLRVTAGNVGIGILNPQSKLAVNGTITSQKVKITQTGWPDYVFDSTYTLRTIDNLENYIQVNKHLPDIPPAREIAANGNDLGKTDVLLLKKIEELTLYLIEMKKAQNSQEKEILKLKAEMRNLKEIQ